MIKNTLTRPIFSQLVGFETLPEHTQNSFDIISPMMVKSDRLDENKSTTKKIIESFNTGDVSAVNLLFSPDYVDHQRPSWMSFTGSVEFKEIVKLARKSLPNLKVSIEDMIAENDTVVVRLQWHSNNSTGKKIERETIDILRFANGQAVEHWGAEAWTSEST